MQPEKPRTNVSQAFADNFKVVQERWLVADDQFKAGYIFYGNVAANLIKSMFYLLPASRIIAKDENEKTSRHQAFIDALDGFRLEVGKYARTHNDLSGRTGGMSPTNQFPLVPEYMELDNKYDALVRQFYLMMFETGFSP